MREKEKKYADRFKPKTDRNKFRISVSIKFLLILSLALSHSEQNVL